MSNRIVSALLACAFVFGTGGVAAPAAQSDPTTASAVRIPSGRIDRAVAKLDGMVRATMRKTGVPGMSVAVVHNDKVVFLRGYGVRNTRTRKPVDANTVFELASVSKSLAASVVAGAVGRGKVAWADPVAKYIPGFTLHDPWVGSHVTIGDMFAHRSGLPGQAGDILEDLGYTRAQIIQRLRYYPLAPFRITYAYANFGLTAGAQAAANAMGTSWEELSRQMVYAPLGMRSTSSRFIDYKNAKDRADLHVRVNGVWKPLYVRDPDAQSPAGGANSTARDMAQWLRLMLATGKYNGKQVVSRDALLAAMQPNIVLRKSARPDSRATFYGYGIVVTYDAAGRVRYDHSGAFSNGAATGYTLLPSEKLGIVILSNGMPVGAVEALTSEFMDLAEFGSVQRDWLGMFTPMFAAVLAPGGKLEGKPRPAHPAPALALGAYTGTYANALYGPTTISARNGKLYLTLGPNHRTYELTHWNGSTFFYRETGERGGGMAEVDFSVPAGATTARRVTLEELNGENLGTFTR